MVSDIKKQMYQSARRYMFSANTDALWINFKSSVSGLLDQLQSGYGIKSWNLRKDPSKHSKYAIYALCTIVPIYPVEKFDITIEITDEELEKYQKDLKILFDEIDKIKDLDDFDDDKMISPCENTFDLKRENIPVDEDNLLLNVPKKKGNFVEVPVMVNE